VGLLAAQRGALCGRRGRRVRHFRRRRSEIAKILGGPFRRQPRQPGRRRGNGRSKDNPIDSQAPAAAGSHGHRPVEFRLAFGGRFRAATAARFTRCPRRCAVPVRALKVFVTAPRREIERQAPRRRDPVARRPRQPFSFREAAALFPALLGGRAAARMVLAGKRSAARLRAPQRRRRVTDDRRQITRRRQRSEAPPRIPR
jgi:hypothetical protein